MKKRLITILFLLSPLVWAHGARAGSIEAFQIVPNLLYVEDDVKVIFSVKAKEGEGPLPPVITLMELDAAGEKIRFLWPLTDDGTQGDLVAGDGLYTRKIQYKERRPTRITFLVAPAPPENFQTKQPPPAVPPSQSNAIEVRGRPSFLEILRDIFNKIWKRK